MELLDDYFERKHFEKTGKRVRVNIDLGKGISVNHAPHIQRLIWVCDCGINRALSQNECFTCGKTKDGGFVEL